jgi:hypothetical protein
MGAVARQVRSGGTGLLDCCLNTSDFVGARVVVTGPQLGHEKLPGSGAKGSSIVGAVKYQESALSPSIQRVYERDDAPVASGREAPIALDPEQAAPHPSHACGCPHLVKKASLGGIARCPDTIARWHVN